MGPQSSELEVEKDSEEKVKGRDNNSRLAAVKGFLHKLGRLIVSVLHTNSVFSWFLLMCSPFGPRLTVNPISKRPKEDTLRG